jgi:signal transduction histidine kinase
MSADPNTDVAPLLTCLQQALGHELPNQLVALQGLLRLLADEAGDRLGPEGRAVLDRLTASTRGAHGLVAALAQLVRLERQFPQSEIVDIEEVVVEGKRLALGLDVVYDLPAALLLAVPRSALRQVLVVLLRFLASAGAAGARIGVVLTGPTAILRLAGPGAQLTPERRERLFEPFQERAPTGLELFAARRLARAWGGDVWVEEAADGLTFAVTAPLAELPRGVARDRREKGPP